MCVVLLLLLLFKKTNKKKKLPHRHIASNFSLCSLCTPFNQELSDFKAAIFLPCSSEMSSGPIRSAHWSQQHSSCKLQFPDSCQYPKQINTKNCSTLNSNFYVKSYYNSKAIMGITLSLLIVFRASTSERIILIQSFTRHLHVIFFFFFCNLCNKCHLERTDGVWGV